MTIGILFLALIILGVLLYAVNLPRVAIEPWVKSVINIVAVIVVVLLLLKAFGLSGILDSQIR